MDIEDNNRFIVGRAYLATPAWIQDDPRKVAVVIGREGHRLTVAWVEDLNVTDVDASEFGREFAQVKRPDGIYNLSSAVPADCVTAAEMMQIFRRADK